MYNLRFSDGKNTLIIVSKYINRTVSIKGIPWGVDTVEGIAYDYYYDVIYNGVFMTFDNFELGEAMSGMKHMEE